MSPFPGCPDAVIATSQCALNELQICASCRGECRASSYFEASCGSRLPQSMRDTRHRVRARHGRSQLEHAVNASLATRKPRLRVCSEFPSPSRTPGSRCVAAVERGSSRTILHFTAQFRLRRANGTDDEDTATRLVRLAREDAAHLNGGPWKTATSRVSLCVQRAGNCPERSTCISKFLHNGEKVRICFLC
jgi:hypothetical protein